MSYTVYLFTEIALSLLKSGVRDKRETGRERRRDRDRDGREGGKEDQEIRSNKPMEGTPGHVSCELSGTR
jgi:hypothetical protein